MKCSFKTPSRPSINQNLVSSLSRCDVNVMNRAAFVCAILDNSRHILFLTTTVCMTFYRRLETLFAAVLTTPRHLLSRKTVFFFFYLWFSGSLTKTTFYQRLENIICSSLIGTNSPIYRERLFFGYQLLIAIKHGTLVIFLLV